LAILAPVTKSCVAWSLLLCSALALGQQDTMTLDDLLQSADQWAKENLDDDALRMLQGTNRDTVKGFFSDIQKRLGGEHVVDLAGFKDSAKSLLPLLQSYEDTQPYASWLKAQLDYLDVAEEVRQTTPPPKPLPGQPLRPVPNPSPQKQRELWVKKIAGEPWPAAATNFVPRLKPIFTAQKVPPELVWIAEVESSFDPRARSPAGAAGLFQLMPATAKRYGLRTWPLDHRLRPDDSARAAAKHLANLHTRFDDWRLALAAYNAGEGTVKKLLEGRKARTYDAIATHLPAETQMYVPRVEATLARREGIQLSQLRLHSG
jgi:membrane-bound lytic murein transglycosylase D